ncbi:MAG: DUF4065 domain-containing protein [Lachnospiraceae bacterium]|nr:DUF4065 domain-containing protein [Lachnospiraceae bacterium]MBR4060057.1 DUF4065 domain-containing protein [Lachnospiraceae bacterium]
MKELMIGSSYFSRRKPNSLKISCSEALYNQALPMGAVPIGHESIIDLKDVPCEEEDMGETYACHFTLSEATTYPSLTEDDKKILDIVIDKLGKMTKNEIIHFMHKEQAYVETAPRDIISFKYADSLKL